MLSVDQITTIKQVALIGLGVWEFARWINNNLLRSLYLWQWLHCMRVKPSAFFSDIFLPLSRTNFSASLNRILFQAHSFAKSTSSPRTPSQKYSSLATSLCFVQYSCISNLLLLCLNYFPWPLSFHLMIRSNCGVFGFCAWPHIAEGNWENYFGLLFQNFFLKSN